MKERKRFVLAADIGGTNSRFALFHYSAAVPVLSDNFSRADLTLQHEIWFATADFPTSDDLWERLITGGHEVYSPASLPDVAVIAAAGPVQDDTCRTVNFPWIIRKTDVEQSLGIRALLLNDFAAQAYACLVPEHVQATILQQGSRHAHAPIAVVGAGTGLGKALFVPGANAVIPSEGGHGLFPFQGKREYEFASFVASRIGSEEIVGDNIVTGQGLEHVYAFLTGQEDSARDISRHIDKYPEVLEWFARFYGRACRNFILDTLALGGLFITGGMALRIPVLEHPVFLQELHASKSHRRLLERLPVRHMRSEQAGLWGAGVYGCLHLS